MNRASAETAVDDAELVRRAQAGDVAAFAALALRYQDRVYNTCYRMCHNHADAADLTQTTLLRALEALPRFEARANCFTWLFRIAVNVTLSHRRAARRRAMVSLDEVNADGKLRELPAATDCNGGSAQVERRELHGRLEQALGRLEEEFRVVLVLKDIEDMDYATIAQVLALPIGTVKSRIHRARLRLRDLLMNEGI